MKHRVQLPISLPLGISLSAILASQFERFSPRQTDEIDRSKASCDSHVLIYRGTLQPDCVNQNEPNETTHPEGGLIYGHNQVVSDCKIPRSLQDIGQQLTARCASVGIHQVTVFLRNMGSNIEYYIADHSTESLIWINNQLPAGFESVGKSRLANILREEYWAHVEAFPNTHVVSVQSISQLKNALSSLAIDSITSDGSTSPFSSEQIREFLRLLSSFGDTFPDEHQTFAVARIWNMVWHARVINNFGSQIACLDRFTALSTQPPAFTGINQSIARAMLGTAGPNLVRCSRAWAGRIAYVDEWRQFKARNEAEWKQVFERSCVILIASLLLQSGGALETTNIISTLMSLSAAAYAHHLMTETQNLGCHAADASAYFQRWEKPEYNVQRIALRNSIPHALLTWAFIALTISILRAFAS